MVAVRVFESLSIFTNCLRARILQLLILGGIPVMRVNKTPTAAE